MPDKNKKIKADEKTQMKLLNFIREHYWVAQGAYEELCAKFPELYGDDIYNFAQIIS